MISVEEALGHVLDLVTPLESESVTLTEAAGRVLASPVAAGRDQPPFPASAMDGYAVRSADVAPGQRLRVIGQSAAGHGFRGSIGPGDAVRTFTGAPVPQGADRVVIQEDVTRMGEIITLNQNIDAGPYVRPAGTDFRAGATFAPARPLTPSDVALLASMNLPDVPVTRKPEIALVATGDELVMPGEAPGADQIIASNTFGLKALIERAGGRARLMPIARDTVSSLKAIFDLSAGADMVVTVGGASVGDHDLVAEVAAERGLERAFYKVAMRPGKPLMAGRIDGTPMIGLPGNPVSAMVCGHVFILPALRRMLGLPAQRAPRRRAQLAAPVGANGAREHYMRARLTPDGLEVFDRQDSSLLSVLADADALVVRPPDNPAQEKGAWVEYVPLQA
ncbi:molybdopterin molybdotransferase MoeA [Tranquillimonas alkanivorans]|uniref:Molybdopterin molybdenumtransferase n=1 Tax=Tranquillimonas alkanivorans TaxID=441119 RepID=A0A1I5P200_9RHOB|nr:gephyrin-like molybdotransferase Glp [Tranquillimonas alkanivorans]SFP27526.1 molybdopterin molybdotransferase [Tranquillimonas alkanivorans]